MVVSIAVYVEVELPGWKDWDFTSGLRTADRPCHGTALSWDAHRQVAYTEPAQPTHVFDLTILRQASRIQQQQGPGLC